MKVRLNRKDVTCACVGQFWKWRKMGLFQTLGKVDLEALGK